MLFSSVFFIWIFLPILLGLYYIVPAKMKNLVLLGASLVFYTWEAGNGNWVLLLLISILMNYLFGLLVQKYNRKVLLILVIICNLGILGYFKYSMFIMENVNALAGGRLTVRSVALPIGISFYTFQALSYVIDVYRKKVPAEKNPLRVGLYISFFPQLVAGPIVKYPDIAKQLSARAHNPEKLASGIRRFIYGLGKKVIIANSMALAADTVYAFQGNGVSGGMLWIAALCYMLQIYYDFSGYSDMAIGLGLMFGFELPENFNYPYLSGSINEFWKRWHMTLTSWFREYVYIPLGGNRKGKARTYINLLVIFLLTGIWHGASWNYIIWGLYHGFFMVLERLWLGKHLKSKAGMVLGRIYALAVVLIGWVIFRIEKLPALLLTLKNMFLPWNAGKGFLSPGEILGPRTIILLVIAILACGPIQALIRHLKLDKWKAGAVELILCLEILAYSILLLISGTYNPFIYYQF